MTSQIKHYKGSLENNQILEDNFYENFSVLPLMKCIIEIMPNDIDIIDNGKCLIFILNNNTMTIDKSDLDFNDNFTTWSSIWNELFLLTETENHYFKLPQDILLENMYLLPNYELAYVMKILNEYLLKSRIAQDYLWQKIENNLFSELVELFKNNEYIKNGYSAIDFKNNLLLNSINYKIFTIEILIECLEKNILKKQQIKKVLSNQLESEKIIPDIFKKIIDYCFSEHFTKQIINISDKDLILNDNIFNENPFLIYTECFATIIEKNAKFEKQIKI